MTAYCVLLVCTDNLCRSPTAEEVLRQKLGRQGLTDQVGVASAATHDLSAGEWIDYHAQKHAMRRDYDLSGLRSKLLQAQDFERFDLILAMDESIFLTLRLRCPQPFQHKIHMFTQYCSTQPGSDVPDPFYGQPEDFEHVLDLIEDGCNGVIGHIQQQIDGNQAS